MIHQFPHKEGDVVKIFKDYQNNLNQIGTAKLVKFHKTGRSFILEDTLPEKAQKVYNFQEWFVDWIDNPENYITTKPYKIRYQEVTGLSNSSHEEEEDDFISKALIDKFLVLTTIDENGQEHSIEIY